MATPFTVARSGCSSRPSVARAWNEKGAQRDDDDGPTTVVAGEPTTHSEEPEEDDNPGR